MLEASIRRVTVKIMWKDGSRERELEVTQFLTRPQEGELASADQLGLDGGVPPGLGTILGGQTPAPAGTTPTRPLGRGK
jgi:hypothetical protein